MNDYRNNSEKRIYTAPECWHVFAFISAEDVNEWMDDEQNKRLGGIANEFVFTSAQHRLVIS